MGQSLADRVSRGLYTLLKSNILGDISEYRLYEVGTEDRALRCPPQMLKGYARTGARKQGHEGKRRTMHESINKMIMSGC